MNCAKSAFLACLAIVAGVTAGLDLRGQGPVPGGESVRPPAPTTGLTVGVVDFVKVMEAYPRAIQERKKIDDFAKEGRATIDAAERAANEIRLKRDDYQQGTFERDQLELQLHQKAQYLDGLRQVFDNELSRKAETYYAVIYPDLQRAVAKVAKDRGVALVLRMHEDVLDGSPRTKARVFESRIVWYAAEEIDLTAAVIQLLQVPLPPDPNDKPQVTNPPTAKESTGGKPGN